VLRPGDIVRLRIWREPDLSGDFKIDETGKVVLPKLGLVDVGHIARDSLKQHLIKSYQAYLRNPTIEVTLLRQVKVLGAVRNPGSYPVDPGARVADAVALAGGATGDGKQNEVYLVRAPEHVQIKLRGDTLIADTPIRSGDQLVVPERSWFSRNPGIILVYLSALTGLAWTISQL
jgi:protein involved in polysaccharide export with SLBB domain